MHRNFLSLLFICVLLTTVVFGQATVGRLGGTISDSVGAVIPNATVTVTSKTTGHTVTTQTSAAGSSPRCRGTPFRLVGYLRVEEQGAGGCR